MQERAGVREIAERVGQSIGTAIPSRARGFVRAQPMAILGTVDTAGKVWASVLTGAPGFMRVTGERLLKIDARALAGDPLGENLKRTTEVGVLIIEPSTRRRMRINGKAKVDPEGVLWLYTEQVYSNCPKYIRARERIEPTKTATVPVDHRVERSPRLSIRQQQWIAGADTFFIATCHPEASADASHRGGSPGFVRVMTPTRVAWDDYPGNNMFQTLGNIVSYPKAGLLFIDFETSDTLKLTGTAEILWDGTKRGVELEVDEVVQISGANGPRWRLLSASTDAV